MNTNVGDMPIEIFGDYISDCLGMDWSWEYIIPAFNNSGYWYGSIYGFGMGYKYGSTFYLDGISTLITYGHGSRHGTYSGIHGTYSCIVTGSEYSDCGNGEFHGGFGMTNV